MGEEITTKRLFEITAEGFAEVNTRIDGVDERLGRVEENVRVVKNDMDAGFQAVSSSMREIIEKLNSIHADVIEIHDLRARVERLEKKVGLHS